VRLPIVVIGGGLTAIDTATESLAYYPLQVEKFLARYEGLVAQSSAGHVRNEWNDEETEVAEEYLTHALAIRAEREAAAREGREPRILELLQLWGGATIAYRKRLVDSPSYTLNHEEVEKALEEGIRFAENLTPQRVEVDAYGPRARARRQGTPANPDGSVEEREVELPARTLLIAAGTQPNTVLAREDATHFPPRRALLPRIDEDGNPVSPERSAKPDAVHVLATRDDEGRFTSFFGDLHPSFFGNVVKAMGSAKQGYPSISRVLSKLPARSLEDTRRFVGELNGLLRATVHPRRAPDARASWKWWSARPSRRGPSTRGSSIACRTSRRRGAAAGHDARHGRPRDDRRVGRPQGGPRLDHRPRNGRLQRLVRDAEAGRARDPHGPDGHAHGNARRRNGRARGRRAWNAVLFSIGAALRAAGSRVLYFAGYKKMEDRYKVAEIEAAADEVVWCCDEAPGFEPRREGDKAFVGNIVEAMAAHAAGNLGPAKVNLKEADRVIAIGSDGMMAAVGRARHAILAPYLKPGHVAIGSINSPMQCMLKEICAQCLQPHVDPATGKTTYVFSCFNQDQALDVVDFPALRERLRQNALQEKLTAQWIDRSLRSVGLRR
jgi:hypothetical protein